MLVLLRFLAAGGMQLAIGDAIRVGTTAVSRTIPRVCNAIRAHLRDVVHMPRTAAECQRACAEFREVASFPHTIGAIDCTHVKIQSPGGRQAGFFRNRKSFFCLNVQTISDRNLRVMDVVENNPGSMHDQTIFAQSTICNRFQDGHFRNYILIGDSGYANTPYLATPYTAANPNLAADPVYRTYNASIISTRNVVERQYGVLKRRFPVLAYGLRLKVATCQKVVVACCFLHNIAIDRKEATPPAPADLERLIADQRIDTAMDDGEPVHRLPGRASARERITRIFRERQQQRQQQQL